MALFPGYSSCAHELDGGKMIVFKRWVEQVEKSSQVPWRILSDPITSLPRLLLHGMSHLMCLPLV